MNETVLNIIGLLWLASIGLSAIMAFIAATDKDLPLLISYLPLLTLIILLISLLSSYYLIPAPPAFNEILWICL